MNRIDGIFHDLRSDGRRALMPFVCAGYPAPGMLAQVLPALERSGASVVEIGFPFSDPIADGPTIAGAMHEALGQGVTPESVLETVAATRDSVSIGLVAMVSYSIVHRLGGPKGFSARASEAGFDGLIVPDLPVEESEAMAAASQGAGLTLSQLVAPTTEGDRLRRVLELCSGFVYLLARGGITGERDDAPEIGERVAAIRELTELPIACGFGISTAEQVAEVVRHADAAIVGSALVRAMGDAEREGEDPIERAAERTRQWCAGLSVPSSTG